MDATESANRRVVTWHPLADGIPPAWASGWGEDATYGPFVEITVGDATQPLRWIPPGQFLMGSPDNEPGRIDDRESPQHAVTISQGFWLFDTPCTQALWEAVMGDNPSSFKSPERPVENVSWHDCQQFMTQLQTLVPGLQARLPTEAEWEYACRAGTTQPTYAGPIEILGEHNAPVLDAIAWYGGNSGVQFDLESGHSTSDWPDKQYQFDRGGTRIVATKKPNAWGLYDMLGNVYEWCRDGQRGYDDESHVDPIGQETASAFRVIRSGSWASDARGVRAAYRHAIRPGSRSNDFGFRCRVP